MDSLDYQTKYVAYLDVLGFKNLVCSTKSSNQSKVARYFYLIDKIITDLKSRRIKNSITSLVVSDSVILTMPFLEGRSENLSNLRELCIAIREIQFELAKSDIWLRGAVTYGKAYVSKDENQIVGEAFIDAYLLEEQTAIFPRVIIDNKLINKLKTNAADTFIKILNGNQESTGIHFSYKRVLFDWSRGIGQESNLNKDVALFIDYLELALDNEEALKLIIKNIGSSIYSTPIVYKKFRWLIDYLTNVIERDINSGSCSIGEQVIIKHLKTLKQL